jgi:hypothetical protein
VAALKALLRLFSYLFHALLALFLVAVSGLALASGSPSVTFHMLPWTGSTLLYVLFFGALAGLVTLALAMLGKVRFLFFVWCLAVAVILTKSYIFSGYRFVPGEARKSLYLILASWISLFGGWFQMRAVPRKMRD